MDAQLSTRLLAFCVHEQHFVLDVRRIFELLRPTAVIPVPGTHPALCGLLPWRNRSLPLLCLGQLLYGRPLEAAALPRCRTIVLQARGQLFALRVGGIEDVVVLRPTDVLDDALAPVAGLSHYVLGVCQLAGRRYLLLDVRPLLALVQSSATPQAPLLEAGP